MWDENRSVYGAEEVWEQLKREGSAVARCTVARLMRGMGLHGVTRGRRVRTTVPADVAGGRGRRTWPSARSTSSRRDFTAERPDRLWVSDLTYVATRRGFASVAFVTDVLSRRIVGWRVSNSLRTDLALDALEQATCERSVGDGRLVPHSDRGGQRPSIRYTERLAEAGIEPSVGSRGDSYGNALAESVTGPFKTEEIHRNGPWRGPEDVELATLGRVWWFDERRLLEPLGYLPPAEYEDALYRRLEAQVTEAALT